MKKTVICALSALLFAGCSASGNTEVHTVEEVKDINLLTLTYGLSGKKLHVKGYVISTFSLPPGEVNGFYFADSPDENEGLEVLYSSSDFEGNEFIRDNAYLELTLMPAFGHFQTHSVVYEAEPAE